MQDQIQLKFVTPVFRASFVSLIEPSKNLAGDLEYSVQMIFEPGTDFSMVKQCIRNALILKFGPDQVKWPQPLNIPLRDGNKDRPDDELYKNCIFAKAKSWTKPGVVDANLNDIIDPNDIYSGMYARASIFPHVYTQINNGVSFLLNNVQKVRDGERLDGKASAQEDFAKYKTEGTGPAVSGIDIFS